MKMIDVLNMMAKGEIKEGSKLKIDSEVYNYVETYTDGGGCSFVHQEGPFLEKDELITQYFLNLEVELIPPKPKKYQLKLHKEDDLSYVTRCSYHTDFNYDLSSKGELGEFITKFTQEEIDNDKFLKFIEQHGIKEVVEE